MQPRKITKGGNCSICSADQSIGPLLIRLDWTLQGIPPGDIDVSLFLLNQDGNVARDADFIFYNQPVSTTGQVRHLSMADPDLGDGKAGFWVDIARLDGRAWRFHPEQPVQRLINMALRQYSRYTFQWARVCG